MPSFDSDGVAIHYEERGTGAPVMLVHGFAANHKSNWGDTGWLDFLSADYRVIAMDCRGHGQSAKPHQPEAYGSANMSGDVVRLLDHLGIQRTLLMGYSMGAWISLQVVLSYPQRIRAVVLGGIGGGSGTNSMADPRRREAIAKALLAGRAEDVTEPIARQFRLFAEAAGNDLKAMAACMSGDRPALDPARLGMIRMPVMIVAGTKDELVGDPQPLAGAIAGAELVKLEGRDHLNAPGDKRYKEAVARFFAAAPA
jgi:pimeloyl-ACP methyl ester carboxylesterase